ncbi:unnamed protein product [Adineta steineri]|uniref:Alpha-mannosidase n=2 Tax=Adineta steineri TaxID=433720 RepID=A0A814T971_9BILA|nr:unnamed protein product [Adineta steineri]CAF1210960.1 unnamed protein product [Adineta steineri]
MTGTAMNYNGINHRSKHLMKKVQDTDTDCVTTTVQNQACHAGHCHNTTTYIHGCDTYDGDDECDNLTVHYNVHNTTGWRNTTCDLHACTDFLNDDDCANANLTFNSCTNGDCRSGITTIHGCFDSSYAINHLGVADGLDDFFDIPCINLLFDTFYGRHFGNSKKYDQQSVASFSSKKLCCEGRACMKCEKCRDWCYAGDLETWKWIRNHKNWEAADRKRWMSENVWKRFKHRDGSTCTCFHGYRDDCFEWELESTRNTIGRFFTDILTELTSDRTRTLNRYDATDGGYAFLNTTTHSFYFFCKENHLKAMYVIQFCTILLIYIVTQSLAAPYKISNGCGYDSCNPGKPDQINVHIVAHTHDDVGWLKTVDQYYYGSHGEITRKGVQYILDSVIQALVDNPDRRFIYVEIAFFWRWWNQQPEDIRNTVKKLVNEGRLEFISGGWSMIDEAATHYNSIIDQHSLGAEFLNDTFGECARPKIGWQIDPFGHSREVASLFAQMGFDGYFFGRADYHDILGRSAERTREMVWQATADLDPQNWLFTGILPLYYFGPPTFCYDITCNDPPIVDDKNVHDYNVPERVEAFIGASLAQAEIYATNHIMMTMGGDFYNQNALEDFKNLDKLIYYVNLQQANGSGVNIFYSTPSCYLYALNKVGKKWPTKTDDFFPYASTPFVYWTGYFTSRPALKRYERYANNILQVTRQLNGFSQSNLRNIIFDLSEAMGLAQHHDAVSGTSKQHVADDYAQRLSDGIDRATDVINDAYAELLPKDSRSTPIPHQFLCPYSNISACLPIEGQKQFTVTLWNPTIHPVTVHHHVPVTGQYLIYDPNGNLIPAEYLSIPDTIKNIPGRMSSAQNQYVFRASLPALGYNTYYFEAKTDTNKIKHKEAITTTNEACILQNEYLRVVFNDQGNLKHIVNLAKNLTVSFTGQGFYWYIGYAEGKTTPFSPASGAYIFRPLHPEAFPVSLVAHYCISKNTNRNCTKTDTVQKASIVYNNWTSQEFSLYRNASAVEIEWIVGPIPIDDNIGKEIIIRYNTDIKSEKKYYTDANGRQVLERIRDYRPTWHHVPDDLVSSNYYPINSRIWIQDQDRQFTILTDRSQGGGSIYDGSIEIMVHRRLLHDDSMGVKEALNETAYGKGLVVSGKHILLFDRPSDSARLHRTGAQQLFMHPLATYSLPNTSSHTNYSNMFRQSWSALSDAMPLNVHLLTFDQLAPKQYRVRVEHYFELHEDEFYSKSVTIDLQTLFKSIGTINDMTELILTANLPSSELHRLQWNIKDQESSHTNMFRKLYFH